MDQLDYLQAYCDRLNKMNWTRQSGSFWFVNSRRLENGMREHYVERRETMARSQNFRPSPEELAATQAVCAELSARGVSQREFNAMVKAGTITRMVNARMGHAEAAA